MFPINYIYIFVCNKIEDVFFHAVKQYMQILREIMCSNRKCTKNPPKLKILTGIHYMETKNKKHTQFTVLI